MEREKTCKNCKYFVLHYIILNTAYIPTYTGHCVKSKPNKNYRKTDSVCEKWESNEDVKREREEDVKRVLRNMRRNLLHIEQILSDDKR